MDFFDNWNLITDYGIRLVAAAVMGAVIGFDREMQKSPAGLRTHMLTALAAAIFTVLTLEMQNQLKAEKYEGADPIRIIEAITVGVSFLAAGSIIQRGRNVQGLTTGAGMWLAGAVGLACGLGQYAIAVMAVILAILILTVLGYAQKLAAGNQQQGPDKQDPKAKT